VNPMSEFLRKATPLEFAEFVVACQEKLSSLGSLVEPVTLDQLIQEAVRGTASDCFLDVEPYFTSCVIDLPDGVEMNVAVIRNEQDFDLAIRNWTVGKPVYLFIAGDITSFRGKLVSSCDQEKIGAIFFSFSSRYESSLPFALESTPVFFATCVGHATAVAKLLVGHPYQAIVTAINCDEVVRSLCKSNPT
jgi:hypothetical protein